MKKLLILGGFLSHALGIYAQDNHSKVESEIRKLEEKERNAMLNHDTSSLKEVWAADFMVNAPFNRVTLSSREVIDLINKGIIRLSFLTRNIEQIMVKKDVVITMGSEEVVEAGNSPTAGQTIKRRYTNIWMKQNGVWRLTARHANEICQK
ncbi:MAG TPA: nuclear transport factor 2 family protein [Chitinophagaceae bacterium]|nr:nuclear transport factor 2 family protein [Chitinophagaceae bacterium]